MRHRKCLAKSDRCHGVCIESGISPLFLALVMQIPRHRVLDFPQPFQTFFDHLLVFARLVSVAMTKKRQQGQSGCSGIGFDIGPPCVRVSLMQFPVPITCLVSGEPSESPLDGSFSV